MQSEEKVVDGYSPCPDFRIYEPSHGIQRIEKEPLRIQGCELDWEPFGTTLNMVYRFPLPFAFVVEEYLRVEGETPCEEVDPARDLRQDICRICH